MKRQVLYCLFQDLHNFPPCIAHICTLKDMGIDVKVLTAGCAGPTAKLLEGKGIPYQTYRQIKSPHRLLRRIVNMSRFAAAFLGFYRKHRTKNTVVWMGTEQGAIGLWPILRHIHPLIVSALEFYEDDWYQSAMKRIAPKADLLTACEPTRAKFMRDWWGLPRLPYVLRNKPYGSPIPKGSGSTPALQDAIAQLQGKKVLLYQGDISPQRDLSTLARALRDGNSDYYLVLYGRLLEGENLEQLRQIYGKTLYLGYFPAPSHLEITSHATIGVTYYRDTCINTRYCAPNKIHEYAGCGIPMLCNRLPGLMDTVGAAGAAECVDFEDARAVADALARLETNYERYQQAALKFYDSVDNTQTMKLLVEDAFSQTKAER